MDIPVRPSGRSIDWLHQTATLCTVSHMWVHLSIAAMAFVVGFSGAMAPGPVLTMTIGMVLKRGFRAGPLIVLGHAILELVLLALVVAGLGPWFALPSVKQGFALVGGALLLLMGGHMAMTASRATREALAVTASSGGTLSRAAGGPILAGIVMSLSTPLWVLWWATIGMGFVTQSLVHGLSGLTAFYCGHIASDLVWYSVVAGMVAGGRRICPPVVYRVLFTACGVLLVILGAVFLFRGIRAV